MANVPKKVAVRLAQGIKRFQPIFKKARDRDVNESDTVTIITDFISDVLGYDKYNDITSELNVSGAYCDLALKVNGKICLLMEIKAVGTDLKDNHLRQAVNYAANHGADWVALTNGITWKIYRLQFKKPIGKELVLSFDLLELNHRLNDHLECLYLLTYEGRSKSALKEYHEQRQAMSRYSIGVILQSDVILSNVRKELKKLSPNVKFELPEIKAVIIEEVLKRDVLEGEKAEKARKKIIKAGKKRSSKSKPVSKLETNKKGGSEMTISATGQMTPEVQAQKMP